MWSLRYPLFKRSLFMRYTHLIKCNYTTKKPSSSSIHRIPLETPLVRDEFKKPLSTKELESIDIRINEHRQPSDLRDHIALRTVKVLRWFADAFFREKYLHRAVTVSYSVRNVWESNSYMFYIA
jgi:hypothetical protein